MTALFDQFIVLYVIYVLSCIQLCMYRIFAEGEFANSNSNGFNEQPLGILPHQIRGSLAQFSQMTLVGHSSNSCTACCDTVSPCDP